MSAEKPSQIPSAPAATPERPLSQEVVVESFDPSLSRGAEEILSLKEEAEAVPEQRPKKSFQVYFEQHDTSALSRMDKYLLEIRAREKIALEEAWRKLDVSGPPKARQPAAPSHVKDDTEADRGARREAYSEDMQQEKERGPVLINEARKRREKILEKKQLLRLSKEEYEQYFSDVRANDRGFQQGNVANCYEVAALHAMSHSPNFELLVRSSMHRRSDGVWEVRIPLLDTSGKVFTISPEEMQEQKNPNFGQRKSQGAIDQRPVLRPVRASEGIRVLEAAYIKAKFGSVNRRAAEYGYGADVFTHLVGQENCFEYHDQASWYTNKQQEAAYAALENLPDEEMQHLDSLLEDFDSGAYMVTVATSSKMKMMRRLKIEIVREVALLRRLVRGEVRGYEDIVREAWITSKHAYSVVAVDKKRRTVMVANPYDTSVQREFTYNQFKSTFSKISAVRINHAKLLRNMETLQ